MPSTSKAQHNFMAGAAHGMKPRSGKGPSVAVAKDFVAADKGSRFAKAKGMNQSNSGGSKRTHPASMPGHNAAAAYSMGKRGAR